MTQKIFRDSYILKKNNLQIKQENNQHAIIKILKYNMINKQIEIKYFRRREFKQQQGQLYKIKFNHFKIKLILMWINKLVQVLNQVKQALQYFKSLATQGNYPHLIQEKTISFQKIAAKEGQEEQDLIRQMVDYNIIYELIELFNSTRDQQTGQYHLPKDIAADGLYVLAIIASGDESFINSIISKNGLTIFKNYCFSIDNEPFLLASAYLGLVNLCSLDRKEVRQHLKSIGLLEHIQQVVGKNSQLIDIKYFNQLFNIHINMIYSEEFYSHIQRINQDDYRQMIENGVWLVSVLCYDPPEGDAEFNQIFNTLPLLVQCLNTENVKIVKDVIWIIDICLTQIPQKKHNQLDSHFSQKLLSLGLSQAFNKTVKIQNQKIKAQTFRGINKLMKLCQPNQIDMIYNPDQIKYILPVLKSKVMHNQYYAINYLNELSYQNRFQEFIQDDNILKQLILIIEQKSNDKFTQLILQSVLKIMELCKPEEMKKVFDSGLLSILETTLTYSEDGEKAQPQNIILSLQILSLAYQHASQNNSYFIKLQRMSLERYLNNLQTHPLENIYLLNLDIIDKYYYDE